MGEATVLEALIAGLITAAFAVGFIGSARSARRSGQALMFWQWPPVEASRDQDPRKFRLIVGLETAFGSVAAVFSFLAFASALMNALRG
jgi:hypothetical protein